jgi:RHS repeat-associated protein
MVLEETVTTGGGSTTYQFVYGLDLVARFKSDNSDETYFLSDGLGSTVGLADDDGDVVQAYDYDAFGNVRGTAPSHGNVFRFAGEQRDPESSLYYLRARYYEPETGRFISKDPVPFVQRNVYAANNPVNLTDPSGEFVAVGIGAAIACAAYVPCGVTFAYLFYFASTLLIDCVIDNLHDALIQQCDPIKAFIAQLEAEYLAHRSSGGTNQAARSNVNQASGAEDGPVPLPNTPHNDTEDVFEKIPHSNPPAWENTKTGEVWEVNRGRDPHGGRKYNVYKKPAPVPKGQARSD